MAADGDRYHLVNHEGIGTIADPVFNQLELLHKLTPLQSIFEIGCTTGFRLEKARKSFGAHCSGLDVSKAAISEGKSLYPKLDLQVGVAPQDLSKWQGQSFDVIVVGHLLYLLPREDLFWFAAWVDSLLKVNGHVILNDFLYPIDSQSAYVHSNQLNVFKGDLVDPWTWNPHYFLVGRDVYPLAGNATTQNDPRNWQTVDTVRKLPIEIAYRQVSPPRSVHEDPASQ